VTRAYYNELDKFCAQWLRNLIAAGHIAPGDVGLHSLRQRSNREKRVTLGCS
jgi:hypothetical protein